MKNSSLILTLGSLLLANSAIAMVPPTKERLEDRQAEFEMRYERMKEHGLSEAEILKRADEAPKLIQLVLRDCKKDGTVSPTTIRRIVQNTVDGIRDNPIQREQAARRIEEIEIARREENCRAANLLMAERMLVLVKEFQTFVHQKQNVQK